MIRSTRTLLMTAATLAAALSLALAPAMAQDEEPTSDPMDAMDPSEEMAPGLSIKGAWTRGSPMVELAGAAYMVIHNSTDADDALIGATSPAAGVVELHLSSMDDEGMMSMNQVTEIPVPAHADAVLEPGGYHIMLIDLVEPLTEGTEVELSLEFLTGEPLTVVAPVMAASPMVGDMDMDDEMDHGSQGEDMDDDGDMDMAEEMEDDEG